MLTSATEWLRATVGEAQRLTGAMRILRPGMSWCNEKNDSRRVAHAGRAVGVQTFLRVRTESGPDTRGPECHSPFTTITAEVVNLTLVAKDEVAMETLADLSRRRFPTKLHLGGWYTPAVMFGGKT